jgi:hypothetical protein
MPEIEMSRPMRTFSASSARAASRAAGAGAAAGPAGVASGIADSGIVSFAGPEAWAAMVRRSSSRVPARIGAKVSV